MNWFIGHYLGGTSTSLTDPRVSPHFATDVVVAASPPTLLITAQYDPLRDEGDAYAARLSSLGVPTSHVKFSGMYHGSSHWPTSSTRARRQSTAGAALGRALDESVSS